MNTADRSIALLDVALRRRFGFIPMVPDLDLVLDEEENKDNIASMEKKGNETTWKLFKESVNALKELNKRIAKDQSLGKDKTIGHAFLFNVKTREDLIYVWKHELLPLIDEYCYGNEDKESRLLLGSVSSQATIDALKESIDYNLMDFLGKVISAEN
jgi:5-methylcytosine-specific restriction protein B